MSYSQIFSISQPKLSGWSFCMLCELYIQTFYIFLHVHISIERYCASFKIHCTAETFIFTWTASWNLVYFPSTFLKITN